MGLEKSFDVLASISLAASSLVVGIIAFLGSADAVSSALLSAPIASVQEMSQTLLPVAFFLALPFAQATKSHVSIDVLYVFMPAWLKKLGRYLDRTITVFVLCILAWAVWTFAFESLKIGEVASAAYQFPIYPAKLVSAVGASLAVLVEAISIFRGGDES